MNMNSFEGKRILALVRDGDYAHAGEEEAIERSFRSIQKHSARWLLDVGCGRGGSADYLRRNGWGHVEKIDRDAESVEYARATYPEIGFHICDVLDVPRTVTRTFDVIYMLNAFYAFDRQREALAELRKVAKPPRSWLSSTTRSARTHLEHKPLLSCRMRSDCRKSRRCCVRQDGSRARSRI